MKLRGFLKSKPILWSYAEGANTFRAWRQDQDRWIRFGGRRIKLKAGCIVRVVDFLAPIGRVTELYTGEDGLLPGYSVTSNRLSKKDRRLADKWGFMFPADALLRMIGPE